jgi:hypothetical protein
LNVKIGGLGKYQCLRRNRSGGEVSETVT